MSKLILPNENYDLQALNISSGGRQRCTKRVSRRFFTLSSILMHPFLLLIIMLCESFVFLDFRQPFTRNQISLRISWIWFRQDHNSLSSDVGFDFRKIHKSFCNHSQWLCHFLILAGVLIKKCPDSESSNFFSPPSILMFNVKIIVLEETKKVKKGFLPLVSKYHKYLKTFNKPHPNISFY